ncbi:Late transcription factor VLTF-4 (1), partial [Monkeypox virus]
KKVKTCKK